MLCEVNKLTSWLFVEHSDVKLYENTDHQQLVNQVSARKQSQNELESSEAQRLLRTCPDARRKSLSPAIAGSLSEDSQMNKRRKVMEVSPNKDDRPSAANRKANLRSLARPLAAGLFRWFGTFVDIYFFVSFGCVDDIKMSMRNHYRTSRIAFF